MDQLEYLERALRERCPSLELRREEPMAAYTSFRVGGPVRLMALPQTRAEAQAVVSAAAEAGVAPFYLGNGSNLLVSDEGYAGFVVKLAGEFSQVREADGQLEAGSAVLLSRLANAACDRGLTGLEFAHGIPGSVGGAVMMNAGAYDGEMSQVTAAVTMMNGSGEIRSIPAEACDFSYRHSAFEGGGCLILGAAFALKQGDRAAIQARMAELSCRRREKQPLEYPSAGSTFKRPAGHFAAALIDQCGLKGYAVGGAQVSEKHAGFVVNRGGAACADILAVIGHVQETVLRRTGVALELEVKTLGL